MTVAQESLLEEVLAPAALVEFVVVGVAKPAGSKWSGVATRIDKATGKRVPVLRANGMPQTFTKDSSGEAGKSWRQEVAGAGAVAMGDAELALGPLAVTFTFVRPRPRGHFGTGRNAGLVKATAPAFPTTRPDVLKLARAAEDALTGIVWRDDSQIVDERLLKVWGAPERLEVVVRAL